MDESEVLRFKAACIALAEKLDEIRHGVGEEFMVAVSHSIENRSECILADRIRRSLSEQRVTIDLALRWAHTPQGQYFWEDIWYEGHDGYASHNMLGKGVRISAPFREEPEIPAITYSGWMAP